jgi:hypothetical protein
MRSAYEDSVTKFFEAQKRYPSLNHGTAPDPEQFGFTNDQEKWEANKIKERVQKEINRIA